MAEENRPPEGPDWSGPVDDALETVADHEAVVREVEERQKPKSRGPILATALVLLVVVPVVMAMLAGIAVPRFTSAIHQADAARIVTDVRMIETAAFTHLETENQLPRRAGVRTVRPDLAPLLPDNMTSSYQHLDYRLGVNTRRGRARFEVRYPRSDVIGEALRRYRRAGEVTWSGTRTTFILDSA